MTKYYRVGIDRRLPLHFAYGTAWDGLDDHRSAGFQVWQTLGRIACGVAGWHHDGSYGPEDGYRYLLEVTADSDSAEDGCDEWLVILPDAVTSLRYCDLDDFAAYLAATPDLREQLEYEEDEVEIDLSAWFESRAQSCAVRFVETLPKPQKQLLPDGLIRFHEPAVEWEE